MTKEASQMDDEPGGITWIVRADIQNQRVHCTVTHDNGNSVEGYVSGPIEAELGNVLATILAMLMMAAAGRMDLEGLN